MMALMTVQDREAQPFHHYTMKHRLIAWISTNIFDNVTYRVRHGLIKGMKRKGGLAWLPEFAIGQIETPELSFWRRQDLSGQVIYDIGAFEGLITLFFARNCRQVVSYEPNTRNHARLVENLRLNGMTNVVTRRVAIGSKHDLATMVVNPLMRGGASIESDTVSGLRHSIKHVDSERVLVTTLDDDIREMSLPAPNLIKIDVEGLELDVLIGAQETLRAHKPGLFIELHGETMALKRKNIAAVIAFLNELSYREIQHIETHTPITGDNSSVAVEGHLYCC